MSIYRELMLTVSFSHLPHIDVEGTEYQDLA